MTKPSIMDAVTAPELKLTRLRGGLFICGRCIDSLGCMLAYFPPFKQQSQSKFHLT